MTSYHGRALALAEKPMMKALLLALFTVQGATALVVAVTHAAGRMGVSVTGQLRERWAQADNDEELRLRAVVKTDAQADRLKLDLCGAVLRNGQLIPLLDLESDLGVEVVVVKDDVKEAANLAAAFEGVDVAVLLSAAHADFGVSASASAPQRGGDDASIEVVPRTEFHARASDAYAAALARAAKSPGPKSGLNVRVPPLAGAAAARRLGAEVAAVASASNVRHVVLRSSYAQSRLGSHATLSCCCSYRCCCCLPVLLPPLYLLIAPGSPSR